MAVTSAELRALLKSNDSLWTFHYTTKKKDGAPQNDAHKKQRRDALHEMKAEVVVTINEPYMAAWVGAAAAGAAAGGAAAAAAPVAPVPVRVQGAIERRIPLASYIHPTTLVSKTSITTWHAEAVRDAIQKRLIALLGAAAETYDVHVFASQITHFCE